MDASDSNGTPVSSHSLSDYSGRIGRFTIPFPYSILLSILMIPALILGAAMSTPVTFMSRLWIRRNERLFTARMKAAQRFLSTEDAISRMSTPGTVVEEYVSIKGPIRHWWTPDGLAPVSP